MVKDVPFHLRFGNKIHVKEATRRFLNRVSNEIIMEMNTDDDIEDIGKTIAFELGEEYEESGDIKEYVGDDFFKCLQILEVIHNSFKAKNRTEELDWLNIMIQHTISRNEVDLGIMWKDGKFVSSGAEELDFGLVDQPLKWLRNKKYKSVLEPYEKGLNHYLHSLKRPDLLPDVIRDMYEAIEALAKVVTGRASKDLSANKQLLISKLGVPPAYQRILTEYIDYANGFRHAAIEGEPKLQPSRKEVESFIYLTGIFLRLASQHEQ